mmetsp:Transcript_49613/g.124410  ORF Transcript_49613/g.124410 Transcript_49613/m.124410 type:complete len:207 (-) Transcript_49613:1299-1919(-)
MAVRRSLRIFSSNSGARSFASLACRLIVSSSRGIFSDSRIVCSMSDDATCLTTTGLISSLNLANLFIRASGSSSSLTSSSSPSSSSSPVSNAISFRFSSSRLFSSSRRRLNISTSCRSIMVSGISKSAMLESSFWMAPRLALTARFSSSSSTWPSIIDRNSASVVLVRSRMKASSTSGCFLPRIFTHLSIICTGMVARKPISSIHS